MAGMVCPFFGAGTLKSTGDSIISSVTTKVKGTGILILKETLQRHSYKYSSQSFLDPIDIALWLVPAGYLEGIGNYHAIVPLYDLFFDPDNSMVS